MINWKEFIPKRWRKLPLKVLCAKVRERWHNLVQRKPFLHIAGTEPLYKPGDVVYIHNKAWNLTRRYSGDLEFYAQEQRPDGSLGGYYGEIVGESWASPNQRIDRWRESNHEYCRTLKNLIDALVQVEEGKEVSEALAARDAAVKQLTDEDRAWIKEHWDFDAEDYN